MENKCHECGQKLSGRVDKKFCSDYCRNLYNNKLHRTKTNNIRNINRILSKNRQILEELNPYGKSKVHKEVLLTRGFDFKFITNIYTTKAGTVYYFCYEQGYLPIDNDFYALVTREEKKD